MSYEISHSIISIWLQAFMRWNNFKKLIVNILTAGKDNSVLTNQLTLEDAIAKIDWLFGCDHILNKVNHNINVSSYYTQSEWGYKTFHSEQDAVHMALNFNGVFDPNDYYVQPKIVATQISNLGAKDVLELGCGKGFNSYFLAQQYPEVHFTGVDLTPLHIEIASQKAATLSNLNFKQGNFNQLEFLDDSFDILFAVECLCHAPQAKIPLAEIFRVLRPDGQLVVFDGFRNLKLEQYSKSLQIATNLTEISMAVENGFGEIQDWTDTAKSIGFHIQTIENISFAIQPTLSKLQNLSLKLFCLSWKAKLLVYLLPKYLTINAIAGLLMPFTFNPESGSLGYYKLILKCPKATIAS